MLYIILIVAFLITPFLLVYLPNKNNIKPKKIILDTILIFLIIYIPLFTFVLSAAFTPAWKGEAKWGVFNLIIETKIILLPLVIWAIAALYTVEIVRPKNTDRYWIVLGIFTGATLSVALFIYGCLHLGFASTNRSYEGILMMIIGQPAYIPIWYVIRFKKLFSSSKLNRLSYLYAGISQLPFWGYAIYSAQEKYSKLPDQAPDCFVATASAQGYPLIVGKPIKYERNGYGLKATKQMIRFWTFEKLWSDFSPRSHSFFRRYYNVWGRKISTLISNKVIASIFYILLKPFEWIAVIITYIGQINYKQQ